LVTAASFLLVVAGVVVLFGAGSHVIDFEIVLWLVAPVFVVLVEAAHRTFFDWSLGTPIRVFPGRLSFIFRGSVRAEIPVAHGRRRATATFRARCPAARTRCEAAASWSRSGTRPVPAWTWSTSWTLLAWTRFAYGKRTSFEWLLIEAADCRFGDRAIRIINEREAARPARFTIDWQNDLAGFTDARQVLS